MAWGLEEQKMWTLLQDAKAQHSTELWVDGARIVQSNETNPRVTTLGAEDLILLGSTSSSELTAGYKIRIVQEDGVLDQLDFTKRWELKLPGRSSRVVAFPRGAISDTAIVGLGWVVTVIVT